MTHTRYAEVHRQGQVADIENLKARAAEGDVGAQYRLAACYEDAVGVEHRPIRALGLYRAAAQANLHEAQVALGTMLALGNGIERDYGEAWVWFSRAARKEDRDAGELARLLRRELDDTDRIAAEQRAARAA